MIFLRYLLIYTIIYNYTEFDKTPPTIDGPMGLSYTYHSGVKEEDIIKQFIFDDNNTPNSSLIIYFTRKLELDYPIHRVETICCKDQDKNITTLDFDLLIYDDIPPRIYGPFDFIFTPYNAKDIQEIISEYYAIDEIDKRVNIEIENDGYSASKHKTGTYYIDIKATDKAGNADRRKITIYIKDEKPNVFYLENVNIKVSSQQFVTPDEMVKLLIKNNYLDNISYINASYLTSDYPNYYEMIGIYPTKLIILVNDTIMSKIEININIIVTEENKKDTSDDSRNPFIECIKRIYNKLIDFFKNLFFRNN